VMSQNLQIPEEMLSGLKIQTKDAEAFSHGCLPHIDRRG